MISKIIKLKKDELVKSSFILFIMINLFNLLNYIFHFSMARMLGPADYSTLAVLFSLIYILSIPGEAIQTIITKYAGRFAVKKEHGKIKYLIFKGLRKGISASLLVFLFFLPFAFLFSKILKINFFLISFTGMFIFFALLLPVLRGVLQGSKRFFSLGSNLIFEGIFKLAIAIFLVFAGLGVYGAISGVLIASFMAFLFAMFSIRKVMSYKTKRSNFSNFYSYSLPFFAAVLTIVLIYSIDVIAAKIFFSAETAGIYAVVSMLGKMIFFGTIAISKAMFPLTSENHEKGENPGIFFRKALKILFLICGIALLAFLFFPSLIINIFLGSQYSGGTSILFIVGLSLTLLSFSNLVLLYALSANKFGRKAYSLLLFVAIEILLFYFFHNSLIQFSMAFLGMNILLLGYSIILLKR